MSGELKCNKDHLQFLASSDSMEPEERGHYFHNLSAEEQEEIVMSGAELLRTELDLK